MVLEPLLSFTIVLCEIKEDWILNSKRFHLHCYSFPTIVIILELRFAVNHTQAWRARAIRH